ncbi:hypothetical protein [Cytophaga aurantiaca]|uniref:hypothetical protein n=1 Tax=Cytophaga aurantiaca TaxID=29530 RepID=UPI000381C5B2|nr:hypothetical protein [Cytophaga aurantiaca]
MKVISILFLYLYLGLLGKYATHYEVECGEKALWLNGKKSCSIYDDPVFLSIYDEANHDGFTVFRLKIQNIGNDTITINPKDCSISRVYANGNMDSVAICNPEIHIAKADAEIARSEKEINTLVKSRNTGNTAVSIAKVTPWANKINTTTQTSTTIYNEKLKSEQNNLLDAKAQKAFWESQALRANTIYPLSYVEGNIFFETKECIKVILHIKLNGKQYAFLINQVTE